MVNDSSFAVDSISMKSTQGKRAFQIFQEKAKVPGSSSQSVFSFESKGSGASVDYESDNDAKLIKRRATIAAGYSRRNQGPNCQNKRIQ